MGAWQPFGGPGGFNDYDSIEVGNGSNDGITYDERKSQLSLWALAAAPLTLGTDLTSLDKGSDTSDPANSGGDLALLTNTSVIAVDQDAIPATQIVSSGSQRVFAKVEGNGNVIVGLFNYDGTNSNTVSVNLGALGISGTAAATDLWTGMSAGNLSTTYSTTLSPGAVQLLKLVPSSPAGFVTYQAESASNTLTGAAKVSSCSGCSGGWKVGFVGNGSGNTLTYNNVNVKAAGTYPVTISYASGDPRSATITVNGTPVTPQTSFTATPGYYTAGTLTVALALRGHSVRI